MLCGCGMRHAWWSTRTGVCATSLCVNKPAHSVSVFGIPAHHITDTDTENAFAARVSQRTRAVQSTRTRQADPTSLHHERFGLEMFSTIEDRLVA